MHRAAYWNAGEIDPWRSCFGESAGGAVLRHRVRQSALCSKACAAW